MNEPAPSIKIRLKEQELGRMDLLSWDCCLLLPQTMVRRRHIPTVFLCLLLASAEGSADHAEDNKGRKYRRRLRQRPARRKDDEREQRTHVERHYYQDERRRLQALPTTFEHNPTYDSAFDHIRSDLNWPAPDSHREDISSTYGPRLLSASDCISLSNQQQQEAGMPCFDFHPGIDVEGIEGDRVVSVYNGTVSRITSFTCGGLVVEIQHDFTQPVIFHGEADEEGHHPDPTRTWYSRYEHLGDTLVFEGQRIDGGDVIGKVGRSGDCDETTGPLAVLHFDVLLSNSNPPQQDLDYDPRVHPFLALPFDNILHNWSPLLIQRSDVGVQSEGSVEIQTRNVRPDVYRVVTRILRDSDDKELSSHVVDFNKREGMNLARPQGYYHNMMYTPNLSEPHLLPAHFDISEGVWSATLFIPSLWVSESIPQVGTDESLRFEVHVTDTRRRRYDYSGPVTKVN